jgi:hypothetical protein
LRVRDGLPVGYRAISEGITASWMIWCLVLKARNEIGLGTHELLLAGAIIKTEGYFSNAVKNILWRNPI